MQLIFPTMPVASGYSWETSLPASDNVPAALLVQYRVDEFKQVNRDLRARISSRVSTMGPSSIEGVTLQVVANGTIWFSCTRGAMLSNEVASQMKMTVRRVVKGAQQETRTDMTMRMSLDLLN